MRPDTSLIVGINAIVAWDINALTSPYLTFPGGFGGTQLSAPRDIGRSKVRPRRHPAIHHYFALSLLLCISVGANAGELEDVLACIRAAKDTGGVELDPGKAQYEFHFFSRSEAKWPNAHCEVDLGVVYNLRISNRDIIIDGFPGRVPYELNQQLEAATADAIEVLQARIKVLKERQARVTNVLRMIGADHEALRSEIYKGIDDAKAGRLPIESRGDQQVPCEGGEQSNSSRADQKDGAPKQSVEADPAPADREIAKAYVAADSLNARTCATTTCGVVKTFSRGQEVAVYERNGGWSRISERENARCNDGVAAVVARGNSECTPANGIEDGEYAAWVASRYLSSEKPALKSEKSEPSSTELELHFLSECRLIVKDKLKDPGSAKFRNVHYVHKRDTSVVCGEINARGGFGGYTGFEKFICGGLPELTVFQSEMDDFAELWNSVCVK